MAARARFSPTVCDKEHPYFKVSPNFMYLQVLKYQMPNECALSCRKSIPRVFFWDTAILLTQSVKFWTSFGFQAKRCAPPLTGSNLGTESDRGF